MKYLVIFLIMSFEIYSQCKNEFIDSAVTVKVVKIVDGDTFKILVQNDLISVRILDIDCFETKHNERLSKQAHKNNISIDSAFYLGNKAKLRATELLLNKEVTIIRDFKEKNIDSFNRLLRHVKIDMANYSDLLKNEGLNSNEDE